MSQNNDGYQATAEVSRLAAHWCLRFKELRRVSLTEALQFLAWLTRSRHHLDEFMFFRRLDDRLTRLLRAKGDRSNVTHVNFWRGSSLYRSEAKGPRHRVRWSAAALVLGMVPAIMFLARVNEGTSDPTFTTTAHESSTARLEDGSRVSLGSDSTLRVEFTELRRDVHFSRGKVTFDVAMDMKRPFVVSTAVVDIAAVESKFSVNIDRSVEVLVYEGVVAISRRGTRAGAPMVTVKKGEKYRIPVGRGGRMVAARGVPTRPAAMKG